MSRTETITSGNCRPVGELAPGVELRVFASGATGSQRLSTGTASFRPGAELPYHIHPVSEAITVLGGCAEISVQSRRYRLSPYDAIHVPAGVAHSVRNPDSRVAAVLHSAFACDTPAREFVSNDFAAADRSNSDAVCPEHLIRFEQAPVYELSARAFFRDLFARRFGSRGICGGYGHFESGASLPCHYHGFDESITIVTGRAACQVAGREYELSNCDTACIPQGRPHRFINRSDAPMAMIWVYAGDEPDRTIVDQRCCDGGPQECVRP